MPSTVASPRPSPVTSLSRVDTIYPLVSVGCEYITAALMIDGNT
jgi:hypothetical protein